MPIGAGISPVIRPSLPRRQAERLRLAAVPGRAPFRMFTSYNDAAIGKDKAGAEVL
jgi:hypothetical protein